MGEAQRPEPVSTMPSPESAFRTLGRAYLVGSFVTAGPLTALLGLVLPRSVASGVAWGLFGLLSAGVWYWYADRSRWVARTIESALCVVLPAAFAMYEWARGGAVWRPLLVLAVLTLLRRLWRQRVRPSRPAV